MKKQLLTLITALAVSSVFSQVVISPSWSISQNAAFTQTSTGIKFMDAPDPNVLWVTGYDGSSPNLNYNWFSRSINGGANFNTGVIFTGPNPAIGDTTNYVLANLEGIDANTAWVSAFQKGPLPYTPQNQGGGVIYRTTNGGNSWSNMTAVGMFTNTNDAFADFVSFFNPNIGVAVGDPVAGVYEIWRTTNGGNTWSPISAANIPPPLSPSEFAIVNLYNKQGTTNLWFGTNQGRMYYTTNTGLTWNVAQVCAATGTITEIAFTTPLNGVAYAVDGGNFELWRTTNGGANWTQVTPTPNNLGLNDVIAIPGTNRLVSVGAGAGNNIISYSDDNGLTWINYGSQNIQYLVADFADNTTGWAGSFSDITNPAQGGIWKYSGAAITNTVAPTSAFAIPSDVCLSGGSIIVTPNNSSAGSPAITYSWSVVPAGPVFSSPTASAPTITFSSGNTYTITLVVTNALGNNTSSQIITVQNCSLPTVNFTLPGANACTGALITPTNSSTGGAPAPYYNWSSSPPANVTFSPSSNVLNPKIIFGAAGVYTITLVGANPQGSVPVTQVITVAPCAPLANFDLPSSVFFCEGTFSTTNLSANPTPSTGLGALSYTWSIAPTSGISLIPGFGLTAQNLAVNFTSTSTVQYTITLKVKNISAQSTLVKTVTINKNDCTGLNDQGAILANGLSVYPNPANEVLNIVLPLGAVESYKVKLVNVLGSVVFEENSVKAAKGDYTIRLSDKPKGVYFLTVQSNTEKVTKKIIIE